MCTLLNMCLPFEIRYIGTCVEDRGKRDYNGLRDTEHHANNVTELTDLTAQSVTEKRTRRKLVLYMALLHSCNYACAVVLYKNLANLDIQEVINLLNGTSSNEDDQPLEELLLLYAMALNHPVFTYDQKNTFGNIFVKLQEEEARHNSTKSTALPTHKSTEVIYSHLLSIFFLSLKRTILKQIFLFHRIVCLAMTALPMLKFQPIV